VLLWACLATGCFSLGGASSPTPQVPRIDWSKFMPRGDEEPPKPATVALDSWLKDTLHCAARRCSNLYELPIAEPGEVKVEVYAPLGRLPDFGVVLLDADAGVLARSQEPGVRPRRLQAQVVPGSYVIHVYALGIKDPSLTYEVIARLSAATAPAKTRQTKKAPEPSKPPQPTVAEPVPPPLPKQTPTSASPSPMRGGVQAEVLDVEERAGTSFVLLDAGAPHAVAIGMRGQLVEGDAILAEIEIVEVFADGSRARILGELKGSISIDTKARIDTGAKR
jgi:hypothetical protein